MSHKTILLVEDTHSDELLTLRALASNKLDHRVDVARDGAEALDYLFAAGKHAARNARELPEVVLLDLKLPKIDGLEVLRRIRTDPRTRNLPVVILTSSQEERDIVSGYKLGVNSYVRKPVDFEDFMEAVGKLGLYWGRINQPPPDA